MCVSSYSSQMEDSWKIWKAEKRQKPFCRSYILLLVRWLRSSGWNSTGFATAQTFAGFFHSVSNSWARCVFRPESKGGSLSCRTLCSKKVEAWKWWAPHLVSLWPYSLLLIHAFLHHVLFSGTACPVDFRPEHQTQRQQLQKFLTSYHNWKA